MQIKMNGRTETYQGPVEIDFQPNENVTVTLADGRILDLFADGTWQAWAPPRHETGTGTTVPAQLLHQGDFTRPADTLAEA